MTVVQEKEAAIRLRLNPEEKRKLEDAARVSGQSLADFVTSTLLRTADGIMEYGPVTVLSARDFKGFMALVESEAEPNEALKAAAQDYRRKLADESLQTC